MELQITNYVTNSRCFQEHWGNISKCCKNVRSLNIFAHNAYVCLLVVSTDSCPCNHQPAHDRWSKHFFASHPLNSRTVFKLLMRYCLVVKKSSFTHCPVSVKQPRRMWINRSHESIINSYGKHKKTAQENSMPILWYQYSEKSKPRWNTLKLLPLSL